MDAIGSRPESTTHNKDLERQVQAVVHFFRSVVYDAAAKACGSAVVGVFLRVLGVPLCLPFLGHSAGMFGVRLVVNLTKEYSLEMKRMVNDYASRAMKVHEQYPHLRIAVFVTAVVCSAFFSYVGLMLGIALGAATALTIELEQGYKRQQVADAKDEPSSFGNIINQLI